MTPMLLTMDAVRQRLEELYSDAPFDVSEFMLRQPGISADEIEEIEQEIGTQIGPSLRDALQRYSLDRLTIGGVTLGSSEGIEDFILANNVDPLTPWWGVGVRPKDLILIGSSDGFAILVNVNSGKILAAHHGETKDYAQVVAGDIELFMRGLGTAVSSRSADIGRMLAKEVGAEEPPLFWEQFASGRT